MDYPKATTKARPTPKANKKIHGLFTNAAYLRRAVVFGQKEICLLGRLPPYLQAHEKQAQGIRKQAKERRRGQKSPCSQAFKRLRCWFEKRLFAPPTWGQEGSALSWGVG